MKNTILLLLPALLLLGSCGSRSSAGTVPSSGDTLGTLPLTAFSVDTFHITETETGCGEGGCATADIQYELIHQPSDAAQDSVNARVRYLIDRFFESELGGGPKASGDVRKAAKDFIASYKEYRETDDFGGSWSADFSLSIAHPFAELYTISSGGWTYTGGAHGNGATRYTVISAKDGKVLGLEDLFTDIQKLTTIAEEYFRQQNMDDPKADLTEYGFEFGEQGFHLNDNFLIGGDGLSFIYNFYEIAPYAAGSQEVTIPLEKIKGLLRFPLTEVK